MSLPTRSLVNLPDYYYDLNTKQKRNWRKHTRKIERNEEVKSQYPPYHPSSNIIVIHLHYQTKIETVEQLIKQAEGTERYALDTESQRKQRHEHGALIQIQMIHSINQSTIILIEVKYLPNPESLLYRKIKELWSTIFSRDHEIMSWGSYHEEIKNFNHLDLVHSGKIFRKSNMQSDFQKWYDGEAHPEMESRDNETGDDLNIESSDDDDIFNYNTQGGDKSNNSKSNTTWSLQAAVVTIFNKFLDKSETLNFWQCGIDLQLGTWKQKLFSHEQYDEQIEQETRLKMKQYAIADCTAVTELFFHISSSKFTHRTTEPETSSRIKYINNNDELSEISENELIEILRPKFDKPKPTIFPRNDNEPAVLTINTTQEEMEEFNLIEQQPQFPPRTTATKSSKQQQQRRKNDKLKAKQRYHPDFQRRMKRPIYYRYNYHKIRSQLADDKIYTSHQLNIDHRKLEVVIGFKSDEQEERAKSIVKINYFSRDQYYKRWGGKQ